jgi:hypothetical protein
MASTRPPAGIVTLGSRNARRAHAPAPLPAQLDESIRRKGLSYQLIELPSGSKTRGTMFKS